MKVKTAISRNKPQNEVAAYTHRMYNVHKTTITETNMNNLTLEWL